jgi:hypothetical protein
VTLRRSRQTTHEQTGPGEVAAEHGDIAGVTVRRARLGKAVVAVVPDNDETEIRDGGEDGRPRPDDGTDRATAHGQKPAVPLGRTDVRMQHDMVFRTTERRGESAVHGIGVAAVRYDDNRPPTSRESHLHRSCDFGWPGGSR